MDETLYDAAKTGLVNIEDDKIESRNNYELDVVINHELFKHKALILPDGRLWVKKAGDKAHYIKERFPFYLSVIRAFSGQGQLRIISTIQLCELGNDVAYESGLTFIDSHDFYAERKHDKFTTVKGFLKIAAKNRFNLPPQDINEIMKYSNQFNYLLANKLLEVGQRWERVRELGDISHLFIFAYTDQLTVDVRTTISGSSLTKLSNGISLYKITHSIEAIRQGLDNNKEHIKYLKLLRGNTKKNLYGYEGLSDLDKIRMLATFLGAYGDLQLKDVPDSSIWTDKDIQFALDKISEEIGPVMLMLFLMEKIIISENGKWRIDAFKINEDSEDLELEKTARNIKINRVMLQTHGELIARILSSNILLFRGREFNIRNDLQYYLKELEILLHAENKAFFVEGKRESFIKTMSIWDDKIIDKIDDTLRGDTSITFGDRNNIMNYHTFSQ